MKRGESQIRDAAGIILWMWLGFAVAALAIGPPIALILIALWATGVLP
jgi:hypothetical protein